MSSKHIGYHKLESKVFSRMFKKPSKNFKILPGTKICWSQRRETVARQRTARQRVTREREIGEIDRRRERHVAAMQWDSISGATCRRQTVRTADKGWRRWRQTSGEGRERSATKADWKKKKKMEKKKEFLKLISFLFFFFSRFPRPNRLHVYLNIYFPPNPNSTYTYI